MPLPEPSSVASKPSPRRVCATRLWYSLPDGPLPRFAHFALTEWPTTAAGRMCPACACLGSPPHVPRLFAVMAVTISSFFRRGARSRRGLSRAKSTAAEACQPPVHPTTTTTLGHSEELSVENAVRQPIPELSQRPEDGSKRPSSVNRQDTGDVFPHEPAG